MMEDPTRMFNIFDVKEPFPKWWNDPIKCKEPARIEKIACTMKQGWDFIIADCHQDHKISSAEQMAMGAFGAILLYIDFEKEVDWENCQNVAGFGQVLLIHNDDESKLPNVQWYCATLESIEDTILYGRDKAQIQEKVRKFCMHALTKFYEETNEMSFQTQDGQNAIDKVYALYQQ